MAESGKEAVAHTRALGILRDRRSILDTLARRLMEHEVVEGAEATAVVHESPSASQLVETGLDAGRERVALTLWVGDDRAEKRL
ncbi:MAG: hypothetical protein AABX36_03345, partial [Candidatus Thermoplasmatota archaeon]